MTATFTRLPATLLAALAIAGAVSPAGAIPASDAAVEAFLGLGNGALDVLIGDNTTDGAAVKTTIVVGAPDTTLAFDWVFDSFDGGSSTYQDFAFFSLVGSGGETAVFDLLAANPGGPYSEATTTALNIAAADTYLLGFGVLDEQDAIFSSMLLLDNVSLGGAPITDGSFENGLGAWSAIGPVSIVGDFRGSFDGSDPFFDEFSPTSGAAQALLDSGDGDFPVTPASSGNATTAAIPEPGTLLPFGLGLLSLGLMFRLFRRTHRPLLAT